MQQVQPLSQGKLTIPSNPALKEREALRDTSLHSALLTIMSM